MTQDREELEMEPEDANASATAGGEEIFDVVDEKDSVLHSAPRSVVHRERLMHRAIHVFVFNRRGQLFLQRRSLDKDTAPGKWVSSCSGHLNSGEDYDTAAARELEEELGIAPPEDLVRVLKESACHPTGNEFVCVYQCTSEGPFQLDADEISDGKWIDLETLEAWLREQPRDFAWSFVHLWGLYRALT
ncbi:MAG: NUDIX hydrolase [Opitutales bacterium]